MKFYPTPMTLGNFLTSSTQELERAEVPSARLDSLLLLEDILHKDRSWILANPETVLSAYQVNKLGKQLTRRKRHEPLAYIRGFSEFYGRKFRVNRHVLEPRPESETMIELLKGLQLPHKPILADVGTGSGCLGITAALEIPKSKVDLYDIDSGALAVARHNCHLHEIHLSLHKRDLLKRPASLYDVVLANLPYVPDAWEINRAAANEPRLAIFGGKDGLSVYRRLFEQLSGYTWQPEYILTEALPPQHEALQKVAAGHGFKLIKAQDFIQVFTPKV
jgi:release factor glutamine methyltransferase